MTRFTDLLPHIPKPLPPTRSWWTDPALQKNRLAFQKHLVDEEIQRIQGSQRFGGAGTPYEKFPLNRKK